MVIESLRNTARVESENTAVSTPIDDPDEHEQAELVEVALPHDGDHHLDQRPHPGEQQRGHGRQARLHEHGVGGDREHDVDGDRDHPAEGGVRRRWPASARSVCTRLSATAHPLLDRRSRSVTTMTTTVNDNHTSPVAPRAGGGGPGRVPLRAGRADRAARRRSCAGCWATSGCSADASRTLLARMVRAGQLASHRQGRTTTYALAGELPRRLGTGPRPGDDASGALDRALPRACCTPCPRSTAGSATRCAGPRCWPATARCSRGCWSR